MLGETLTNRLEKPEEVATRHCSHENSFVTGIDIKADGGLATE